MSTAHKRKSLYRPVPFDPIQYVKRLESVGFTREQAEMQSETFFSIVQEQLVTKQDLKELEGRITVELESIRRDIKELEGKTTIELESIRRDIKELDVRLVNQMEFLRRDLKIWFGGMLVTLVVSLSGIVTLMPHLVGH